MKRKLLVLVFLLPAGFLSMAQVNVDKPVNLSGAAEGDRAVTNLATPVNDNDAANKKYVDDQVAAAGGGFTHYIGEPYGGGVVCDVYLDGGNEHGLIVNVAGINAEWSNVTSSLIGASAQNWLDGAANTAAITSQVGHSYSAAQYCLDYSSEDYSDWYLPAYDELGMIYEHTYTLNRGLSEVGGARLDAGSYWSSTEGSAGQSWRIVFPNGASDTDNKSTSYKVRCVRAF